MSSGSDRKPKHAEDPQASGKAQARAEREAARAAERAAAALQRAKTKVKAAQERARQRVEEVHARTRQRVDELELRTRQRVEDVEARTRQRIEEATERVRRHGVQLSEPRGRSKDDARTLALLWSANERAGRTGLSVRAIVDAAVELADREGLEAVSMRRVADQLEVGTMSLYTHVPGKAELMDLMTDTVYGELYDSVEQPSSQRGGYRAGLHFVAERYRALYQRHPWLLDVPLARPVLGPNACLKYEAEVRVLDGVGLTDPEIDSIVALLVMHVQSTARSEVADRRAQQSSGLSEVEWWTTTIPLLLRVRTGHYPVAGRVGPAAGQAMQGSTARSSAEHLYRFGLALLCDAVQTMVERHRNA